MNCNCINYLQTTVNAYPLSSAEMTSYITRTDFYPIYICTNCKKYFIVHSDYKKEEVEYNQSLKKWSIV